MKRQKFLIIGAVVAFSLAALCAHASPPKLIADAMRTAYVPAIPHRGLETAYAEIDPGKLRGFVVVEKGGIPVEKARYFVGWDDYDYRGAVVHLNEKDGERITTRRGAPYAYLQRGDVLAVVALKDFSHTLYLRLISADVYVPGETSQDKHHSRVTVELGFDLPKAVYNGDDAAEAMRLIGEWIKPFPNREYAEAFSRQLKAEDFRAANPTAAPEGKAGVGKAAKAPAKKAAKENAVAASTPTPAPAPAEAKAATAHDAVPAADAGNSERVQTLEQKIEAARKEIDQAQQEIDQMKKSPPKN